MCTGMRQTHRIAPYTPPRGGGPPARLTCGGGGARTAQGTTALVVQRCLAFVAKLALACRSHAPGQVLLSHPHFRLRFPLHPPSRPQPPVVTPTLRESSLTLTSGDWKRRGGVLHNKAATLPPLGAPTLSLGGVFIGKLDHPLQRHRRTTRLLLRSGSACGSHPHLRRKGKRSMPTPAPASTPLRLTHFFF